MNCRFSIRFETCVIQIKATNEASISLSLLLDCFRSIASFILERQGHNEFFDCLYKYIYAQPYWTFECQPIVCLFSLLSYSVLLYFFVWLFSVLQFRIGFFFTNKSKRKLNKNWLFLFAIFFLLSLLPSYHCWCVSWSFSLDLFAAIISMLCIPKSIPTRIAIQLLPLPFMWQKKKTGKQEQQQPQQKNHKRQQMASNAVKERVH